MTVLRAGRHRLPLGGRTLVMGIVNNTPDSFYDRGRHEGADAATRHARALIGAGADIVDVGGQTAQLGPEIPAAEETARVVAVIAALAGACVSVDTYRAAVAAAALDAGASIVNDHTGGSDRDLAAVAAAAGAGLVVTHYRGPPRANASRSYDASVDDVLRELSAQIDHALASGVAEDAIVVDPGLGFGKSTRLDLALMRDLGRVRQLGFPLLVACSHKEFTADASGTPEDDLRGTAAAVAIAARSGAEILRLHDVAELAPVIRLADAVRLGAIPAAAGTARC